MGAKFLNEVHTLRAFAIGNVVILHVWNSVLPPSWIRDVNNGLFHNSTVYFALISGLLFTLVLKDKGWDRFFRSKPLNVLAPYLLFTAISLLYRHDGKPILDAFLLGQSEGPYWYIPVVMVLFALTPMFDRVVKFNSFALIAAILPLFVTRTGPTPSWENVVHMGGAYVVGMWIGKNYPAVLALAQRYWRVILSIAISAAALAMIEAHTWQSPTRLEAATYTRSIAVTVLFLPLFAKWEAPEIVKHIGDVAFPIYFMHSLLLSLALKVGKNPLVGLWATLLALLLPVYLTGWLRGRIGTRSRVLVGA